MLAVVRDGSFLGVVAEREEHPLRALSALRAGSVWREEDSLPAARADAVPCRSPHREETVLSDTSTAPAPAARSVHARFTRPYLAPPPSRRPAVSAVWAGGRLSVWSHSQGVSQAADGDLPAARPGPGGRRRPARGGRRLLRPQRRRRRRLRRGAARPGGARPARPGRVDPRGRAELGSAWGRPWWWTSRWTWTRPGRCRLAARRWSNGHSHRPGPPAAPLLAATTVEAAVPGLAASDPPLQNGGGMGRNAVPLYDLPGQLVRTHRPLTMPLRTSALRALGPTNVYAIESVVDELAALAGVDPVEYRLRMLGDERARGVLKAAAELAGWGSGTGPGRRPGGRPGLLQEPRRGAPSSPRSRPRPRCACAG